MADDEEITLIQLFEQDMDIADILCNRMKFYIYTEIIDCIQQSEDLIYFFNIFYTYNNELIILNKEYDYITFLYTIINSGVFEIVEITYLKLLFQGNENLQEKYQNIITNFNINSSHIIEYKRKFKNYNKKEINKILKNLKLILKSIFLTNYIDINNIYAITCLNIYLYKTNKSSVNKIKEIVILLGRLLLLTNVFYLNNYTKYLRISYNNYKLPDYKLEKNEFKETFDKEQLTIFLNKSLKDIIDNINKKEYDKLSSNLNFSLQTIIFLIFNKEYYENNENNENNEKIKINKYILTLININKYILENSFSGKYFKINLFVLFILLYYSPLSEKFLLDKHLVYFFIPTEENKKIITPTIKDIYNKIKSINDDISINIVSIIKIIFPEIIDKSGGGTDEITYNNIYIFNKISSKMTINTFNEFKNIFTNIDMKKCNEQKIKYIKNNKNIDFNKYLLGGNGNGNDNDNNNGNDKLIIGGELLDTLNLNYKDPTYLLNYIPMDNCKRLKLLDFIKNQIKPNK
jgi:hypothetical protein